MQYLTVKQAAEKLQVTPRTIFRRIADGSLPCHRLGTKTIRIIDTELEAFVNGAKKEAMS